jgi:SAM-dependent methyltransferase
MPIDLICHCCKSPLDWPDRTVEALECRCGERYPCVLGIPDFRRGEDPYCGNEVDQAIAAELAECFAETSFAELLDRYFHRYCPDLRPEDVDRQKRHLMSVAGDGPVVRLANQAERATGPLLDLGCGSGGAIIAFSRTTDLCRIVGLDVALRWLILARKRLDDAGLADYRLVCGLGERMPFADQAFGAIFGGDVIEHVADAPGVFAESARVLKPGGSAVFVTPNRTSLSREPHVGLYFAGWLPSRWAERYCRLMKAPNWKGIFPRTSTGWRHAAGVVSGRYPEVEVRVDAACVNPGLSGGSVVMRFYDAALDRSFVFRRLARMVGPVLEIRMKKGFGRTAAPAGPFREAPGFQQQNRPGQRTDE